MKPAGIPRHAPRSSARSEEVRSRRSSPSLSSSALLSTGLALDADDGAMGQRSWSDFYTGIASSKNLLTLRYSTQIEVSSRLKHAI